MRLIRRDDTLVVPDQFGMFAVLGAFFAAIGAVFVYGSFGGFRNAASVSALTVLLARGMGCIGIVAGLGLVLGTRQARLELDRASRRIRLVERQWGRRTVREYAPGQIRAVQLLVDRDAEGSIVHGLALELPDGTVARLGALDATPREEVEAIGRTLQREAGIREWREAAAIGAK